MTAARTLPGCRDRRSDVTSRGPAPDFVTESAFKIASSSNFFDVPGGLLRLFSESGLSSSPFAPLLGSVFCKLENLSIVSVLLCVSWARLVQALTRLEYKSSNSQAIVSSWCGLLSGPLSDTLESGIAHCLCVPAGGRPALEFMIDVTVQHSSNHDHWQLKSRKSSGSVETRRRPNDSPQITEVSHS